MFFRIKTLKIIKAFQLVALISFIKPFIESAITCYKRISIFHPRIVLASDLENRGAMSHVVALQ